MKTSIVIFKMLSLCAFFFLVSCEKSEPLQLTNGEIAIDLDRPDSGDLSDDDDASHTDPNDGNNFTDCPVGSWEGTFITEAVYVDFHAQFDMAGPADDGDWQFLFADGSTLNKGEIQVSFYNGYNIVFTISETLAVAGYELVGTIDPDSDCEFMSGKVYKDGTPTGSFRLEKQ